MLARVVDQVGERAPDQRRIGGERERRRRRDQLGGVLPGALERPARDLDRVERLRRHGLELDPRAGQELAHESVDLDRLPLDLVQRARIVHGPLALARLAADLHQQPDPRQRRAQLV